MNNLMVNNEITMKSSDLHSVVNQYRINAGLTAVNSTHFLARVIDEIDDLGLVKTFTHPQNKKTVKYYDLDKDQCLLVGMRESKAVRKSVLIHINNLQEEIQNSLPDFNDPIAAAEAFIEAKKGELKVIALLEQAKPDIDFANRCKSAHTGSKGFRETAAQLGVKEKTFRAFLFDNKVMYKLAGSLTATAMYFDKGYFEIVTGEKNSHVFNTTKFTPSGIAWIDGKLNKHNIERRTANK